MVYITSMGSKESAVGRAIRHLQNRQDFQDSHADRYAAEKARGERCEVEGCVGKVHDQYRGGVFCRIHGRAVRRAVGEREGLCNLCGENPRMDGYKTCRECVDRVNYNQARYRRGESNSRPLAVLVIKEQGDVWYRQGTDREG